MTLQTDKYVLRLESITKKYGDVTAAKDISLSIQKGEFLTLLGPSGSGKTTILLMIAGFQYPTSGDIIIKGRSMSRLPPEKRDVGMVFQNYALFPHMTIYENVAFPLKMRKLAAADIRVKVAEALKLVRLSDYEMRYPKQLSGGQQQRIALARAIVFNPSILLMDEPLGALDKKLREYMQLEIKRIQQKLNITVVYVTHDQEEALVMSDKIAVMDKGEIMQLGTPQDLYEKPKSKFVAGFIGESNFIEGKVVLCEEGLLSLEMADDSAIRIPWPEDIPIGTNVCFMIRPDRMQIITQNEQPKDNSLRGVIKEIAYAGNTARYKIEIGKEKSIEIRELTSRGKFKGKEGDEIAITWDDWAMRKI